MNPTALVRELAAKIDLGERPGHRGSLCSPCDPKMPQVWYPSLYVSGTKNEITLPDTGKAIVEYKVTSRTTRERDGQKSHSADIEIRTIEPLEAKKPKPKFGGTFKLSAAQRLQLLAAQLGKAEIAFERPRDGYGQFAPGETAGTPEDMAKAYGHPATRPSALKLGGAAVLGAGALAGGMKLRQILARKTKLPGA